MKNKAICLIAVFIILSGAVPARPADGFPERYQIGYALYESGQYAAAITHFREMLKDSKPNSLSDNCQYWIGESFFLMGDYAQALMELERTLTYSDNNKGEDAQYKIAQCHEMLGEIQAAREMYTRFIVEFPTSNHVPRVIEKLDMLNKIVEK